MFLVFRLCRLIMFWYYILEKAHHVCALRLEYDVGGWNFGFLRFLKDCFWYLWKWILSDTFFKRTSTGFGVQKRVCDVFGRWKRTLTGFWRTLTGFWRTQRDLKNCNGFVIFLGRWKRTVTGLWRLLMGCNTTLTGFEKGYCWNPEEGCVRFLVSLVFFREECNRRNTWL